MDTTAQTARLYVCIGKTPAYWSSETENLPVVEAVALQSDRNRESARVLMALSAGGWDVADDGGDDTVTDYVAVKSFASVEDAVADAKACGAEGRTLDYGDESLFV